MEIERNVDGQSRIEMWAYDWDMSHSPARKINRKFVEYEQPVFPAAAQAGVCGVVCVP